ncbi:MAG: DUF2750 domain-containing protein, partial [Myxococcales bacterium]|nr:DUF2750 domain-containing protein [Myxococcales bacterium]
MLGAPLDESRLDLLCEQTRLRTAVTLQDVATSLENYERFLTRVVEYDRVWALRGESGFETCESNEFEECSVLLFWSDAAYAR